MVLTYAFLYRWVQEAASCLMALEPKCGAHVGLLFEQDLETRVAKYAVLKAGKTYIELDGTLPLKQMIRICERHEISCVMTHFPHTDMVEKLSELVQNSFLVVNLDHLHPAIYSERDQSMAVPVETRSYMVVPDWRNVSLFRLTHHGLVADIYNFESNDIDNSWNRDTPLNPLGSTEMEHLKSRSPGYIFNNDIPSQMKTALFKKEFHQASADRDHLAGIWTEVLPRMTTSPCFLPVRSEEKREYYPVSPAQRRIFYLDRSDVEKTPFITSYKLKMNVPANDKLRNRLEQVLKKLIRRHEILRTSFHVINGDLIQKVHKHVEFKINPVQRFTPTSDFDLSQTPLIRIYMKSCKSRTSELLIQVHSIAADSQSMDILIEDLMNIYNGGQPDPPAYQYKDYALWYARMEREELFQWHLKYWSNVFPDTDQIPVLNLPYDFPRHSSLIPVMKVYDFILEESEARSFLQLTWFSDVNLLVNLSASFSVLLSRWSGQDDLVLGVGTVGRNQVDPEEVMGPFENFLPLRIHPESNKRYRDVLMENAVEFARLLENQDIRLERLQDFIGSSRDGVPQNLFNVVLMVREIDESYCQGVFETSPSVDQLFKHSLHALEASRLDLVLQVVYMENELYFRMRYNEALISKETIAQRAQDVLDIIRRCAQDPDLPIGSLSLAKP